MNKKWFFFGAIFVCSLATARADESNTNCKLKLELSNVTVNWNVNFSFQAVTFRIQKENAHACNFAVTFGKGGASDYNRRLSSGTSSLNYQLYGDASLSQVLREVPDLQGGDTITGSFDQSPHQVQYATFYLQIPQSQSSNTSIKPAGSYTDTVTARIYDTSQPTSNDKPDDTESFSITANIAKTIEISMVNSGAGFRPGAVVRNLDFGTLTPGESQAFDLRIRSNAGYAVYFSSNNRGVMKLITGGSGDSSVPYQLTVNSIPYSLAGNSGSQVLVASGSGQTGLDGAAHSIVFTIGSTEQSLAGQYQDYILVTVSTTE